MRQFVLILLLCMSPPQFALAASVDARLHAGSSHHHAAQSHARVVAVESTPDTAGAGDSSSRAHGECGACHCFHSVAMLGARADFKRPTGVASNVPDARDDHHRSAVSERPERPNWSTLV